MWRDMSNSRVFLLMETERGLGPNVMDGVWNSFFIFVEYKHMQVLNSTGNQLWKRHYEPWRRGNWKVLLLLGLIHIHKFSKLLSLCSRLMRSESPGWSEKPYKWWGRALKFLVKTVCLFYNRNSHACNLKRKLIYEINYISIKGFSDLFFNFTQ